MFYLGSDDSDDAIHDGFDEDQMGAIAKLLRNTNVTVDERFSVYFNVHERREWFCYEKWYRIKPASANLHFCGRKHPGNKTETLEEIYQNQEEIPKSNVTRFVVTVEKLIELKGWRCTYVTDYNISGKTLEFEWCTQGSVLLL